MFKSVYGKFRRSSFFEKLLLVAGMFVGVVGFWLINTTFKYNADLNWPFISSIFLWIMLIFLIILTDSNESIKDELGEIIKEHIEETKLLKKELVLLKTVINKPPSRVYHRKK